MEPVTNVSANSAMLPRGASFHSLPGPLAERILRNLIAFPLAAPAEKNASVAAHATTSAMTSAALSAAPDNGKKHVTVSCASKVCRDLCWNHPDYVARLAWSMAGMRGKDGALLALSRCPRKEDKEGMVNLEQLAERLIAMGAQVDSGEDVAYDEWEKYKDTPLTNAAENGHLKLVRLFLLSLYDDDDTSDDPYEENRLLIAHAAVAAAYNNKMEVVDELIGSRPTSLSWLWNDDYCDYSYTLTRVICGLIDNHDAVMLRHVLERWGWPQPHVLNNKPMMYETWVANGNGYDRYDKKKVRESFLWLAASCESLPCLRVVAELWPQLGHGGGSNERC